MARSTKDNTSTQMYEDKLKYLGLDLSNLPKKVFENKKINFKPLRSYEDNNYKVYKYIDVEDIDILITPEDRLNDLNEKYKKALPLSLYLDSKNEETSDLYNMFLNMLGSLDVEKLKEIEKEQDKIIKTIPYEVKYRNNYIWQIYYSENDDRYFMLFSTNENNSEALFYLIKKKLSKKKEKVYVPISHVDYTSGILKKTEITDLENYLWLFTKEWPNIYEIYKSDKDYSIEIIGKTKVYEDIKSNYKIILNNHDEAQKFFKLIKALFILQSNDEIDYDFKPVINDKGGLDFYYNDKKVEYDTLSEFIKEEVDIKQKCIDKIFKDNISKSEKLDILKQTVEKQKEEFLLKEQQISVFLECKKTFFGKVRYFFKRGKKIDTEAADSLKRKEKLKGRIEKIGEIDSTETERKAPEKLDEKALYTIEDLLKVCEILKDLEIKNKNMQLDINALEQKSESLERKIKNATQYIEDIESHRKSIFEFWKFTNKDEKNLLVEGEKEEQEVIKKLKREFRFETDIEEFSKKVDIKQKETFSKVECDAVFAVLNDLKTFKLVGKDKLLKKDDKEIENALKDLKKEYKEDISKIKEKDFDIFGNVAEDKTKIKVLKNNKHREIEKNKFKILDIKEKTTLKEYKETISNYRKLLVEAYGKVKSISDISLYKASTEELDQDNLEIFDLNGKEEIENDKNSKNINIYKINVKENMPLIFYSNIMYFDNINKTLPDGMDISTKALIDLSKFELKQTNTYTFNSNTTINEFENNIQTFNVYEYNLKIKK